MDLKDCRMADDTNASIQAQTPKAEAPASRVNGDPERLDELRRCANLVAAIKVASRAKWNGGLKHAVEVLRDDFKADDREIADAFGEDVFDILSTEGVNQVPVTGWMMRECALFKTFREKRGRNAPIGGVLRSITNPKQSRRDLLAAVVQAKTAYLDACDRAGDESDEAQAAKAELKATKDMLPCVVYQGLFDGEGKGDDHFVSANGVFGLDYDFRRDGDAAAFKTRVFSAPFVGAAWLSASGKGVHALALGPVTTTAAGYRDAWDAIEVNLHALTGEHADPARKNRNGLLSPSHDIDLLWRRAPATFEPKTPPAKSRSATKTASAPDAGGSALERQLERVPNPDLHYDDWRRVVFVVRDEFGQAGRAAAERWSAKSGKHQQSGFDDLWNSTPRTAGERVSWGTLVQMAGGFNARMGRPRDDEPMSDTLRQRAKRAARQLDWRFLEVVPAEIRDAERVLEYCADFLLLVKSVQGEEAMLANANGLWEPLEHRRSDRSTGALARVVRKARTKALEAARAAGCDPDLLADLAMHWSVGDMARAKGDLARQIAQRVAGREVPVAQTHEERLDDRSNAPIIPLEGDVGGWHIKKRRVVSATEVAGHLLREKGWHMPEPVEEPWSAAGQVADEEIAGRYAGLFERTAALLVAPAKVVDIFACQRSSFGKSTFYDWLRAALPGMIIVVDARSAYNKSSMRFTPVAAASANAALVVVDGCGHVLHDLPSSVLDAHTDVLVTIELKGQDRQSVRRAGNLVLVGHDWPKIDVDAQGASTRLRWALRVPDSAPPLSQERRDALMSPEGVVRFRWRLIEKMGELANDSRGPLAATEGPESRKFVAELVRERGCPVVAAFKDTFEIDAGGFTPSSEVDALAKDMSPDGAGLSGKDVAEKVRKAFGSSVRLGRRRKRGDRGLERGWIGLRTRTTPF